MELFIVDAFTNQIFGGNQAGVVLLEEKNDFPDAAVMQKVAAELKHSETAFVKAAGYNRYKIMYFTPTGEIDLCGHATISAFTVLRKEKKLETGSYMLDTKAGSFSIEVAADLVWMEMARGKLINELTREESIEVYRAFGLNLQDKPDAFEPCIVSSGLADILLPVKSRESLGNAVSDGNEVLRLSKKHEVAGIHMFCYEGLSDATAYCRNFAPLYGIEEEAATGTSNGALTYYLNRRGLLPKDSENIFIQGESMGKPSEIHSRIRNSSIDIGGNAVISVKGSIRI
jgi:phenazine biosynthesis protein PhzF family